MPGHCAGRCIDGMRENYVTKGIPETSYTRGDPELHVRRLLLYNFYLTTDYFILFIE